MPYVGPAWFTAKHFHTVLKVRCHNSVPQVWRGNELEDKAKVVACATMGEGIKQQPPFSGGAEPVAWQSVAGNQAAPSS